MDEWIEDGLSSLGDVEVRDGGRIRVRPKPSLGDSWSQVQIDGRVRERKNGEVELELNYDLNVNPASWVLGILFIPLGILIFITINQTQTRLMNRVRDVLHDLEDDAEGG